MTGLSTGKHLHRKIPLMFGQSSHRLQDLLARGAGVMRHQLLHQRLLFRHRLQDLLARGAGVMPLQLPQQKLLFHRVSRLLPALHEKPSAFARSALLAQATLYADDEKTFVDQSLK